MLYLLTLIGRSDVHSENGQEKGVYMKSRIVHGFFVMGAHFFGAGEGTCFLPSGGCIPPLAHVCLH